MLQSTRSRVPIRFTATGMELADHVLEQKRRAPHRQDPVGDGGQLQIRVHRCGDSSELAALFEKAEKPPQVTPLFGQWVCSRGWLMETESSPSLL